MNPRRLQKFLALASGKRKHYKHTICNLTLIIIISGNIKFNGGTYERYPGNYGMHFPLTNSRADC